jgi:hypothetical protein
MSSDVPDWVRSDCRLWGRQKRRIWEGCDWHGNVDGYAQSLLGRIREERDGAGQGTPSQKWPEVFWGAGLDVQRCLLGMPERQYAVLHFQYVWNPDWGVTAARKAEYIGLKRTEYFELVDRCETWIHARLDLRTSSDSQLVERVREIVAEALHLGCAHDKKAQIGEVSPATRRELNLAALNRKTLSAR